MYCNDCGAQIQENSKFCSHCGKPQNEVNPSFKEKVPEKINKNEVVRQVVEVHKRSLDYQFLRKVMGWYLAWVLLHLGILLIASHGIFSRENMGADLFWPFGKGPHEGFFGKSEIRHYDITEFLVYTIFPLAILIIWSMIRKQNYDNQIK